MSVNLGNLDMDMVKATTWGKDLGYVFQPLEAHELNKFGMAFQRQFVQDAWDREIADLMLRHRAECLLGAMVAKRQMEAEIDGEQPAPGKIGGPLSIRACWFGIGDDWEDINGIYAAAQNSWSTGTPQRWIHSGTTLLAGTAGNPVKILESAVHVIVGIGTFHAAPKFESCQWTIDGKEKPIHLLFRPHKIGSSGMHRQVKEFDNAIILKKNQTVLVRNFISVAFGAMSDFQQDYPFLMGCSFIKEDALRLFDPSTVPGVNNEVITVT